MSDSHSPRRMDPRAAVPHHDRSHHTLHVSSPSLPLLIDQTEDPHPDYRERPTDEEFHRRHRVRPRAGGRKVDSPDLHSGDLYLGVSFVVSRAEEALTRYSVALVVLFSDSLNAVWPIYTSDQWKVVGLVV